MSAVLSQADNEMPAANSNKKTKPGIAGGVTPAELHQYIERIETIEEQKTNLSGDIREVYAEAKGNGFDTKIMRMIIRLRKLNPEQRAEQDELLELYRHAVGLD